MRAKGWIEGECVGKSKSSQVCGAISLRSNMCTFQNEDFFFGNHKLSFPLIAIEGRDFEKAFLPGAFQVGHQLDPWTGNQSGGTFFKLRGRLRT